MQLSIADAARLYGKQRKTLYRHMAAGRLSYQVLGSGRRALDLSELIRVYGEPPDQGHRKDTPSGTRTTHQGEALLWRAMLEELQLLRREVADLRKQLTALPAPPGETGGASCNTSPSADDRQRGKSQSLADVAARFEARARRR